MKPSAKQYLDECLTSYPALEPCQDDIVRAFEILVACFKKNGKALACGNGGSAADADHIVGEMMNKFALKRELTRADTAKIKNSVIHLNDKQFLLRHLQRQLPAISLSAHSPLVTAIANDEDAEMIFAQQVFGHELEVTSLVYGGALVGTSIGVLVPALHRRTWDLGGVKAGLTVAPQQIR